MESSCSNSVLAIRSMEPLNPVRFINRALFELQGVFFFQQTVNRIHARETGMRSQIFGAIRQQSTSKTFLPTMFLFRDNKYLS